MSQPDPQTQTSRPRWTFISVALFVIGLLILVPSGLCTGLVLLSAFSSLGSFGLGGFSPADALGAFFGSLSIVLVVGGVPMVLGAVLMWAGFKARPRD